MAFILNQLLMYVNHSLGYAPAAEKLQITYRLAMLWCAIYVPPNLLTHACNVPVVAKLDFNKKPLQTFTRSNMQNTAVLCEDGTPNAKSWRFK
eukprot:1476142-Amphidinium_carterae.2